MEGLQQILERKIRVDERISLILRKRQAISEEKTMVNLNGLICTPFQAIEILDIELESLEKEQVLLDELLESLSLDKLYEMWNNLNSLDNKNVILASLKYLIDLINKKEGELENEENNTR